MPTQQSTRILRAAAIAGLVLSGCGGDADSASGDKSTAEDTPLHTILVEISHEAGAAPYQGGSAAAADPWDLFTTNMDALIGPTGVVLYASATSSYQDLGDLPATDFSAEDLLALDAEHRQTAAEPGLRVLHVIWVDGYYESEGERQTGVLGVSVGDTGVIGMFKPVIETLGATEVVRTFGEQTTLIHEVGHAVGLVNNGVPMVVDHQDAEHGAHCDDDRCVMYWANEGVGDLAEFVSQVVTSGETVIFDDACLQDIWSGLQ